MGIEMVIKNILNLSEKTKRWIYSLSRPFVKHFKKFKELRFDVYLLSGERKVLYITSSVISPYIVERICRNASITKGNKIYIWELRKFISQYDTVLIDMHRSFARFFNDAFLIPPYVRQVLDLDKPIEDITRNNRDLKKIKKYQYEVLTDLDSLKFFYEKMHVPYIRKRFANSAQIKNFNEFKKTLKNGELLLIKNNEKYVSGVLCEMRNGVYFWLRVGALDESFVKEGALSAAYYFGILRAKEKNAKIIDFGMSRPFLSDGVLRHKRKWGARICEDKSLKRILYSKNAIKDSFICIENKKLKAVLFSNKERFTAEYANWGLEFKIVKDV